MSDLLTDSVLPVLGLCPPGSLLLPWLAHARAVTGRTLDLPVKTFAATFAVAKRVANKGQPHRATKAPVAAVLLEAEAEGAEAQPATLVMMDWSSELGPHSGLALRSADPKAIFGIDLPIGRRCLVVLTLDDILPQPLLWDLAQRLDLSLEQLGWLGLRSLYEVLTDYLRRTPRDRWRAPERTASDLVQRLMQRGIRPWQAPREPPDMLLVGLAPGRRWRYEPLRPGSREFPWCFAASEEVCNAAMVLEARLVLRKTGMQPIPGKSRSVT